jgi:hypothetical protein
MSELANRLHKVDPDLKIVSPHHKHSKHGHNKTVNLQDWEASEGNRCPKCGQTDVRFINGVCRNCYSLGKEKITKKEASLNQLIYECKDKRLASRIQKYLSKKDRAI